ncbi:MAG: hypothetical protein ABI852_01665 [Gemmatimonadaceae bacterium]
MNISEAQREIRDYFIGGCYGQFVSGIIWMASAALATWSSPRAAIGMLVVGGFFIFPLTELLIHLEGRGKVISPTNTLKQLGMQVAFVLPLSMPLILPVVRYRLNWFFPAMMILVGAHYLPFVFLYGMRMFIPLAALLLASGMLIAMVPSAGFSIGAWVAGAVLLTFAFAGRRIALNERQPN